MYHFEHRKKVERLEFLHNIDILSRWTHEKITDFNLMLKQRNYDVNETIYNTGDTLDNLYILKSGILSVKSQIILTEENKYPVGLAKWEIIITECVYEYELHHLQEGDIFGH